MAYRRKSLNGSCMNGNCLAGWEIPGTSSFDPLSKLAIGTALVVAAIEWPVSQHYATVPPTRTAMRMGIAAAMAFAGVMIAGRIFKTE
jgi:hypothetical protein